MLKDNVDKMTKDELMEYAESLGLEPHHATGATKLMEMIKNHDRANDDTEQIKEKKVEAPVKLSDVTRGRPAHAKETKHETRARLRKEQLALKRVIVRCNDESKSEITGENKKFGNSIVGSYTKFVPYDLEEGYHLPVCLIESLSSHTCQKFKNVKRSDGTTVKMPFQAKAYTITILPDLTSEELAELADDQRARGAID